MDQDKINILRIFQLDGTPVSCEDYGSGHVNVTFLVVTDTGRRYILQKINHHAFRNVQALSENIAKGVVIAKITGPGTAIVLI